MFHSGEKYSKTFGAKFMTSTGKPEMLQMGCYGLGISRIFAAAIEVLSTGNNLSFPEEIVPYQIAILAPKAGSKEAEVTGEVYRLYDQLNNQAKFRNDIIIDDRGNLTIGKKLREAKKAGYRHIILFGKDCINEQNPVIELYSGTNPVIKLSTNEILYHFETINSHTFY